MNCQNDPLPHFEATFPVALRILTGNGNVKIVKPKVHDFYEFFQTRPRVNSGFLFVGLFSVLQCETSGKICFVSYNLSNFENYGFLNEIQRSRN